jgi:hypothetical protein
MPCLLVAYQISARVAFVVLMIEWSCRVDPRKLVKAAVAAS